MFHESLSDLGNRREVVGKRGQMSAHSRRKFRLAERRLERELIAEYEALVAEVCAHLDGDKHTAAGELLALAQTVRGYGVVKERSIEVYRAALTRLRGTWRTPRADQAAGFWGATSAASQRTRAATFVHNRRSWKYAAGKGGCLEKGRP